MCDTGGKPNTDNLLPSLHFDCGADAVLLMMDNCLRLRMVGDETGDIFIGLAVGDVMIQPQPIRVLVVVLWLLLLHATYFYTCTTHMRSPFFFMLDTGSNFICYGVSNDANLAC